MKIKIYSYYLLLIITLFSCNSYRYIHDQDSLKRQKELVSNRSAKRGCDAAGCFSSTLIAAIFNINVGYLPSEREFKHLSITNPTTDTMFVNMLTDATLNNEEYCDFNDVRIPPGKTWRVLVPIGINYNLYYGSTDNPDKDELLEINTQTTRKLTLHLSVIKDEEPEIIEDPDK